MTVKLKLTASSSAVGIPLHVQSPLPEPREVHTGAPHAVPAWQGLPLRSAFDPSPRLPWIGRAPSSFQDFLQIPKTRDMISQQVVVTAVSDPAGKPVTWSGDLGCSRAASGNSIRIEYSTPGQKIVTASCDGVTSSVAVSVFRLEIVEPVAHTDFFISAAPTMPAFTARAAIVGIQPDPIGTVMVDWTAQIRFDAKSCPHGPKRSINPRNITQKVQGGRFMPAFPLIRGGELTLIAKATYANQTCEARTAGVRIQGTNPPRADIQAAIAKAPFPAELQQALQRIACQESGQRQFLAAANGGTGWPYWSEDNKGGVGILQLTNPQPSDDCVWNWRDNVAAGIHLFKQKLAIARGFPEEVRKSPGFQDAVDRYNAWRKDQGLPPLKIRVPEYDNQQLALDTVRAFNGFGGRHQFGLWCHEFQIAVQMAPERVRRDMPDDARIQDMEAQPFRIILRLTNINEATRTADAIWERVPVNDRPQSGDPDYVNNILSKDPACGG